MYNCENNIDFIESDFLKIEEYKPVNVKADYIFLSPPWGGIQYKNSDIYSIRALMKPDIFEIVKVSLRISKHIMFYVPRTLMLEELFEILSQIKKTNRIFFDVHILKSANKIKALLIIFGYNIDSKIKETEIDEYLKFIYDNFNITDKNIKILCAIAKIIGNFRFFENEICFRKSLLANTNKNIGEKIKNEGGHVNISEELIINEDIGKELYNFFYKSVLTDQEKIKLKSLNIFHENKNHRNTNNNTNKSGNGNNIIINIYNNNNFNINKYNYIFNNNNINKIENKNIGNGGEQLFPESETEFNVVENISLENKNKIKEEKEKSWFFIPSNEVNLNYLKSS